MADDERVISFFYCRAPHHSTAARGKKAHDRRNLTGADCQDHGRRAPPAVHTEQPMPIDLRAQKGSAIPPLPLRRTPADAAVTWEGRGIVAERSWVGGEGPCLLALGDSLSKTHQLQYCAGASAIVDTIVDSCSR